MAKKQMNMRKVFIREFLSKALNMRPERAGEAFRFNRYYQAEFVYRYLRLYGYVPNPRYRIKPLD